MEGDARYSRATRQTHACMRTMSCVRSRRIRVRGYTEKYESFLQAINASAYSQGRPTVFIRPYRSPSLDTFMIISRNPVLAAAE